MSVLTYRNLGDMPNCLWCGAPHPVHVTWGNLLYEKEKPLLCAECSNRLEKLEWKLCNLCGRSLETLDEKYISTDEMCHDCTRWETSTHWSGLLDKNRSLYHYNDFLQEIIGRYKFRGDAILSSLFTRRLNDYYHQEFSGYHIVPIPLSKERLSERGFNQAELLATTITPDQPPLGFLLKKPFLTQFFSSLKGNSQVLYLPDLLTRTRHETKQSKRSRVERMPHPHQTGSSPFAIPYPELFSIKDKQFLLIDDIYTTGSTVRKAAKILNEHGAAAVSSLTIARG
ncbi:ComF family protein [Thalassorhabdus alkalitolerans]|uniref:ComF family protein n=1 Tax=Thalassorhabdus alkalitolerans TaxID=2282697 RepID=A0ABW0YJ06_9BACI